MMSVAPYCREGILPSPARARRPRDSRRDGGATKTFITLFPISVPRPVLDPDRRPDKAKGVANLVFQKTLVGEVEFYLAVGEDYKCRRSDRRLRHVEDPDLLTRGHGSAFEIHVLEKAIHFSGSDAPAAFSRHFFQHGKDFLGALAA